MGSCLSIQRPSSPHFPRFNIRTGPLTSPALVHAVNLVRPALTQLLKVFVKICPVVCNPFRNVANQTDEDSFMYDRPFEFNVPTGYVSSRKLMKCREKIDALIDKVFVWQKELRAISNAIVGFIDNDSRTSCAVKIMTLESSFDMRFNRFHHYFCENDPVDRSFPFYTVKINCTWVGQRDRLPLTTWNYNSTVDSNNRSVTVSLREQFPQLSHV